MYKLTREASTSFFLLNDIYVLKNHVQAIEVKSCVHLLLLFHSPLRKNHFPKEKKTGDNEASARRLYSRRKKDDRYNFKMTFHISFVSGAPLTVPIYCLRARQLIFF